MAKSFPFPGKSKYLLNCFIMALPILIWNIVLTDKLPAVFQPEIFWKGIPLWVKLIENGSRLLLFLIMLLLPLRITTVWQKRGFLLYLIGILTYFGSWLMLMYFTDTCWSRSLAGFLAPSYTPLIWLTGIGMMGGKSFVHLPFLKRIYLATTIVFTIFHCGHTYLIFSRNNNPTVYSMLSTNPLNICLKI